MRYETAQHACRIAARCAPHRPAYPEMGSSRTVWCTATFTRRVEGIELAATNTHLHTKTPAVLHRKAKPGFATTSAPRSLDYRETVAPCPLQRPRSYGVHIVDTHKTSLPAFQNGCPVISRPAVTTIVILRRHPTGWRARGPTQRENPEVAGLPYRAVGPPHGR